jgi:SAM-dependent methyltransferase
MRLLNLLLKTEEADARMGKLRPRFTALKENDKANIIISHEFYETPEHIAQKMAALLTVSGEILEPSAGLGRLYFAAKDKGKFTLIDINAKNCEYLFQKTDQKIICADFLTYETEKKFDGVIMNPPFHRGEDIKHVLRAKTMLKPGGELVALCYNGKRQNEALKTISTHWEIIPRGTFKNSAETAILKIKVD